MNTPLKATGAPQMFDPGVDRETAGAWSNHIK